MHPSKRETRRERLLAAAAVVFSEKGYAGTTVADVAERVGIGKGTVYGYFKSKDDLFLGVFDWYLRRMEKEVRPELSTLGEDTSNRLLALTETIILAELKNIESYTLTLEFWSAAASSGQQESFRKAFAKAYAHWREIVANLIHHGIRQGEFRKDTDVQAISLGIVGMCDAVVIQHWLDTGTDPVRAVQTSMRAILSGISNREKREDEEQT